MHLCDIDALWGLFKKMYFKGRNFHWKKLSRFRGFWPISRNFLPRNLSKSLNRESLFCKIFKISQPRKKKEKDFSRFQFFSFYSFTSRKSWFRKSYQNRFSYEKHKFRGQAEPRMFLPAKVSSLKVPKNGESMQKRPQTRISVIYFRLLSWKRRRKKPFWWKKNSREGRFVPSIYLDHKILTIYPGFFATRTILRRQ